MADREFLYELLNTPSPTGFEVEGQKKWAAHTRPWADDVESDSYGTVWATLRGRRDEAPTTMLEAHGDEIGFIVKHITDEGYIHIDRIGGSDRAIARSKRLHIFGDDGPVLGVIGNTAIHLRENRKNEKIPKLHKLFVDIGAESREDVEDRGIRVGHPAVYTDSVEELTENRIVGRGLDNRMGGYIIAQALALLAEDDERPTGTTYVVNSVQEEIGGNGAQMISYRLNPSIALVVDVTHATDSPGINQKKHGKVILGDGPTITHGTVNHPKVIERIEEVADAEDIPLQHESSSRYSGTDTDSIFTSRSGIPSALISLPLRYMHSTVETVDLEDAERVARLMAGFVRSLSVDDEFRVSI
jgi:endoglucanase